MATENFSLDDTFILRGESFKEGMLLLIEHLTEQDWKLGNKFLARLDLISNEIETLYDNYQNDLKNKQNPSFEIAEAHFKNLITSYISILDYHTILKDPFQSLCDAERCSVWKKGRKHFGAQFDNNDTVKFQIVLSETPYTDSDILQPEYTILKTWFKSLPKWQQAFIRENEELSKKSIPSSFRSLPGLANTSFHECKIEGKLAVSYFRHATQLPIDLLGKKGTEDEQFRLTCLNVASQIRLSLDRKFQLDNAKKELDNTKKEELVILSQSLVSPGKVANLKAKFISAPNDNDTQIYELKEKAIQLFQHALANPEAKIDDDNIKALFFTEEERKNDLFYKDFLNKWGLTTKDNQTYRYKQYKPVKLTLLSTNHPFNALRYFGEYPLQVKQNESNTALLLGAIARYLEPLKSKNEKLINSTEFNEKRKCTEERLSQLLECLGRPELDFYLNKFIAELKFCEEAREISDHHRESIIKLIKDLLSEDIKVFLGENTLQLLDALQTLLSIPEGQGYSDKKHAPQLRSSAEIAIVNCLNGAAWMACKSGKDRTGGASIAMDAAAMYYHQYKQFPQYHDKNDTRKNYLKILERLYRSDYHQKIAAENAPGAKGLIKSTCFFPGDLKLDASRVSLETELARLNKPKVMYHSKKKRLGHRVLKADFMDDLQDIKGKIINGALGTNATFPDWKRNWEGYYINDKSVNELRKNKDFEDEEDLSTFIETHLLAQIENQELKKYYKTLILYSFHQGGFPHAFSKVSMELINKHYKRQGAIIGQPEMQINFSWSEDRKGIQIEEINTYKEKKDVNTGTVVLPDEGEYYCQTQSCILLNLNEAKDGVYKLAVSIQSASVDCTDELKPLFFKKSNLLETFIQYLQSLLTAIKHYFDKLIKKPGPMINESWLSKTNPAFFQKSTAENEEPSSTTKLVFI